MTPPPAPSGNVLIAGPVAWNLLIRVDELPRPEPHTVFAGWHHETLGGTSAGKALNLARLGLGVTLATLLADDDAGRRIAAALREPGIDLLAFPSANGSERHVNLMDRHGARLSVYLTLPRPALSVAVPATVLAAADAVVADLADHSRPVLRAARAAGRPIWCDLHDYDGESEFHREFAEAADYLFVSDERLPDPESFLRARVAAGAGLAVCTHGARGATALARGGDPVHVEATRVDEVVDTNGAGDAFFAGFLAAHLRGAPLLECLRQASRAGALAVRTRDLAPADLAPESIQA
ncbi:carbohydrate kinase family protein [Dactylosporangium sucinum]|uniref:carbohydrate kinase family protein n=1 Tax=Dactylosporangium sucinum TaxID=1424081 RepID=UPI001E540F8E|nr:PfkB family carbohydrate kinase [Dactylosporangium sucinum]